MLKCIVIIVNTVRILHPVMHEMVRLMTGRSRSWVFFYILLGKEVIMDGVNKTLYIPLYGKSMVSKKNLILKDPTAEHIWTQESFPLKGKSKSKWLAYYMGMRAWVFDEWLRKKMCQYPEAVVLHIGCGMDSRIHRVGNSGHQWFDVDFEDVIKERKIYYEETETYHMIASDARETAWLAGLPKEQAIVVCMSLKRINNQRRSRIC